MLGPSKVLVDMQAKRFRVVHPFNLFIINYNAGLANVQLSL